MQIFSTLGFSVLYSTLVLYITQGLQLTDQFAIAFTGSFIAFNYALHLLGGYVGGRLLSYRELFIIGMILQACGCSILALQTFDTLLWGVSVFLTGCGLNVICINCMLTQLFDPQDKKRESAFLWNYSAMNVGFLIGFSVSGIFQVDHHYFPLFIFAAAGSLISLTIALISWRFLKSQKTILSALSKHRKHVRFWIAVAIILILIIALSWLLLHAQFSNDLIMAVGVLIAFFLAFLAFKEPNPSRSKKLWAFLILSASSLVFWTLYQMSPMSLTLFFERNVHRTFFDFSIPPQWLQNINTILIIIGGPVMARANIRLRKKGFRITIPRQFTLALFLIGIGFLLLPLGIFFADAKGFTAIGWVIGCYVFQSLGELFISPIGYAMIGQLIPSGLQGITMGVWLMVTGVAATLSNLFSQIAVKAPSTDSPLISNHNYSYAFFVLGIGAIVASIILFALIRFLQKLIHDPHGLKAIEPAPYNAPQD